MLFCCGLGGNPTKDSSSKFDEKAFRDNVRDLGRAYRHRGIELIKICQTLSAASPQRFEQDKKLTSVLKECDAAIERAIHQSGKKRSEESDALFEMAARNLNDYARSFHEGRSQTISDNLKAANKKDVDRVKDPNGPASIDVEFHILSTLPCKKHTIVKAKQKLSRINGNSVLPEILWNFSHFKPEDKRRLRLAQKPHFYTNLPKSSTQYGGAFDKEATENYEGTIYVLTNSDSRRVFFEFAGKTLAFENFWETKDALIFKDVTGNLKGEETLINKSILGKAEPPFEYYIGHSNSSRAPEKDLKYAKDWKVPIEELLEQESPHKHVRIKAVEYKDG